MAISGVAFTSRSQIHLRNPILHCARKAWPFSVSAIEVFDEAENNFPKFETSLSLIHETDQEHLINEDNARNLVDNERGDVKFKEWKKLSSDDHGIKDSMITNPTRKVLRGLRQKGYDVYLVGGCVRDLLLNRTPKDFDVITSAELREVKNSFAWCNIVGSRFPICHVHLDDTFVEVSSFRTSQFRVGDDLNDLSELPIGFDEDDRKRWKNCLHRDFTINGFMFDPFANIVYDYLGGIKDLKKAKVQTVIPAGISFQEDSARILRAIRIAARLGFRISRETAHFVKHYSYTVLRLGKARLMMEINYMLAYGSAEASLRILWKFGLLEMLLPIQAAYFARTGFRRRDKRTNMLLSLFSNMDKLLAPDKPCHGCLWVAVLAFHKALYDRPRNPLVVATLSLAMHNGGDISEAIQIASGINALHDTSFDELTEPRNMESDTLKAEVIDLVNSILSALNSLTNERVVSNAMAQYPKAPVSNLVLIPLGQYLRACQVFECVKTGRSYEFKEGSKINYESLALGSLEEVRYVLARIVFDTVYPLNLASNHSD